MTLIDNKDRTLQDALKNALISADRVDIGVGFFYFSGFQALAEELRHKKVRILVGLEIDPQVIPEITQQAKGEDVDLTPWQPRRQTTSLTALRDNYIQALIGFTNDSDIFDDEEATKTFDLYMDKIADGSLEIRKTLNPDHSKYYVLHNDSDSSQNGEFPGTVFMGSSNLTYRGLRGQGELNDSYQDKEKFNEFSRRFESSWQNSQSIAIADIHSKDSFIREIKEKIWSYVVPDPYHLYVRVLHEIFNQEDIESLLSPGKITNNRFTDLQYQIDAVRTTIDRLNKYDGAILADVVGLGKSVIASAVARNLDMRTVIIAPPHLVPQWEEYKEEFGIRGSRVFSSGKIDDVYERYQAASEPLFIMIDEAHRFRNEDIEDYKKLHQICRSNPGNKILLLTATPFNNAPKDVFALIKLFQTPGRSTIRSVDNLSLRFHDLIDRYKKLRKDMSHGLGQEKIDFEATEIANEQRRLIETVVIRRSRLDLKHITRYREDLVKQNIAFADIVGPELMEYDLGPLFDLYIKTLEEITGEGNEQAFIGARYKPATYVQDRERFIKEFGDDLEETDLRTAQTNLSQFMRRLLVMRFESSKDAFRSTLEKMITANQLVEDWWTKLGKVPIMKKGQLPNPNDFNLEEDGDENENTLDDELAGLRESQGLLAVDISILDPKFIKDVRHDIALLKQIHQDWFGDPQIADIDPKLDGLCYKLDELLRNNPERKIVIFSAYADTVNYLYEELQKRNHSRTMCYTATDSTAAKREIVRTNFDASLPVERQSNDFDILIATDALSEGYNLHRAGVVINYDIPFNPTRVIQRIGRINRINKKVFDQLYIYNCFPTAVGEAETRIKQIATLKIKLINAVVGSDTMTLTDDEELASFFKDEFDKAEQQDEQLSWDARHREAYDQAKKDPELLKSIMKLPHRSRVRRNKENGNKAVVFGKKGEHSIFTTADTSGVASIASIEQALPLFDAKPDEEGYTVGDDFIDVFKLAKEKLFAKHELPSIKGRRADAITVLKALGMNIPSAHDYCEDVISIIKNLDDISDGTLKDIMRLNLKDTGNAFEDLQKLVPAHFIRNVYDRANRDQNEQELLLFAEEFKV